LSFDEYPHKAFACRSGWFARVVVTHTGARQITDLLFPGEISNCGSLVGGQHAAPVLALTDAEICLVDGEEFVQHFQSTAHVVLGMWRSCLMQVLRMRDLLTALGTQASEARFASFVLSLRERLLEIGLASPDSMPFPLRQVQVADLLGMSQVQISRILNALASDGIMHLADDTIEFGNLDSLIRIARR